ncbi:MAG: Maltose/maltodextrin-binding protein precursor [Chloroflexi bacterium ADurb.Bin325]|nr:MAG: Maltose/maltodextrin-binding protein precursor [Chloroflexi bacterium ADurb.Bin325]
MAQRLSRRTFLRFGGIAAGASALAACVAPTAAPAQPAAPAAPAEEKPAEAAPAAESQTTVEWWDAQTGVDEEITNKMIETFEGKNPDIKINRTYIAQTQGTQANDKLLTAIAAGTPPDVFKFDRFIVAQFAAQGFLTDLTEFANRDGIKADDYWDFAWEEANYNGKLYALPYDTDTRALWYNKDIFEEAGLDPEKPPQTLAELQEIADKLTVKGANDRITRWGYIPTSDQAWTYTYGFAFRGEFQDPATKKITCAHPQIVESMKWLRDYSEHVGVQNLDDFVAACAGNVCNDQNDYFWTGQTAMTCSGDWRVSQQKRYKPDGHYGVTPFPGPDGPAPHASWAGGWSWVVPAGAKNVDGGWRTVNWVCGPEGQDMFNKGTYHIPTNKKAAEDPYYREDPLHAVFMDLLPVSHTRPPIPAGSLLWDRLVASRDEIVHGKLDPEASLKAVDEVVNAELEKLGFFA